MEEMGEGREADTHIHTHVPCDLKYVSHHSYNVQTGIVYNNSTYKRTAVYMYLGTFVASDQ